MSRLAVNAFGVSIDVHKRIFGHVGALILGRMGPCMMPGAFQAVGLRTPWQ
jgi:hypothetical protein